MQLYILLAFSALIPLAAQTQTMEKWNYPYDVQTIELSGGKEIAYIDTGKGPQTLLFVHGLGSYLRAWDPIIEDLKSDYRCLALDLPGYGKSAAAVGSQSMDFFAKTLLEFINRLTLDSVTLVGHSMGGQIAITTVLQDSNAIDRLVLVAPAGIETFTASDRNFFQTFVTPEIIRASSTEQIQANFELNFHAMPDDARFMIEDRLTLRADTAAYRAYSEMIPKSVMGMLEAPVRERLSELRLPTLLFFGLSDRLIPNTILHPSLRVQTIAEEAQAAIPGSQLVFVSEAGHFVHWEGTAQVNAAIRTFLQ